MVAAAAVRPRAQCTGFDENVFLSILVGGKNKRKINRRKFIKAMSFVCSTDIFLLELMSSFNSTTVPFKLTGPHMSVL